MSAADIVYRNGLVAWRGWRATFVLSVLAPVMFVSAMGLGLGKLVDEGVAFGGIGYLEFVGTGMLAAFAMQNGVFGATYPIMNKIIWQRVYDAILASPLSVRHIVFGELGWACVSAAQVSLPFFVILLLFGVFESLTAVLAIPAAVLLAVACAAPMFAYTATMQTDESYTWIFRLVVTPMFLLGGTFFPIAELPAWGRAIAQVAPVFHGVELVRQAAFHGFEWSALWHVAYLAVLFVGGTVLAIRNLEKRLQP